MQRIRFGSYRVRFCSALCAALSGSLLVSSAMAAQVDLTPSNDEGDATLYSYDKTYVAGDPTTYPVADGTSHLHVGDTNNNKGVQRGLIQFDLSGIPSGAMVTDVSLTMVVADVPDRVLLRDINFWMVAMESLSTAWSQGPGSEQSAAVPGDTTWLHTTYDPALHGELGNTTDNPFRGFELGNPGSWPAPGYFGDTELTDTEPGEGEGGPFDDAYALVLPKDVDAGKVVPDEVVNWNNARLLSDVQSWVDGTKDNFGWIMVGEEWIDDTHTVVVGTKTKNASSKIDFYSSETGDFTSYPDLDSKWPILHVTYSAIPEPGAVVLLLAGLATLLLRRIR